jgi:hypothetical protein
MSLSNSEAARTARAEAARHAIEARWSRTTDPEQRRAQTRPARIAAAVRIIVDAAPDLTPDQVARLRAIFAAPGSGPHGTAMPTPNPEFDRIEKAFNDAFRRMCAAPTEADLESELSNLLNHLYRLGELCKRRLGEKTFYSKMVSSDDLRRARAAMWARAFDAHRAAVVAPLGDRFSDFYTEMYGVAAWEPLANLPEQTDKWGHGRHLDYTKFLEGMPVLDTTRRAFDAMAALL